MSGWGVRLMWGGSVAYVVVAAWSATALPAGRVPIHWGFDGTPDNWSSRTGAIVLFVVLGVVVVLLFLGIMAWLVFSERMPRLTVPNRDHWTRPENVDRARAMAADDVAGIGGLTMALLACVPVVVVQAANAPGHALPSWFLVAAIGWLALVSAWIVAIVTVRWRIR